ncbi:MAG TPA: sigma-70 family RNA polymerase sigma factor [Bryobacteraceae bacterium]|nr:sigma-70 family RNA polymerase sigma factor [Bryobacteraceae bacterium]
MSGRPSAAFPTTRWTLIASLGSPAGAQRDEALLELCRAYWQPVYWFIRRCGHPADSAQDLAQDFFLWLLEKPFLERAEPDRARFRSYLLGGLKHFLSDEWDRRRALKRGGSHLIPVDLQDAEEHYERSLRDTETPETVFDRRYALTIVHRATGELRASMAREGKEELFGKLQGYLPGGSEQVPYAEIAGQLGTTEGAVRVTIHRLRRRCRDLIRAEIANLVLDPSDVDSELQFLIQALSAK